MPFPLAPFHKGRADSFFPSAAALGREGVPETKIDKRSNNPMERRKVARFTHGRQGIGRAVLFTMTNSKPSPERAGPRDMGRRRMVFNGIGVENRLFA
jgi:hypothetical protein